MVVEREPSVEDTLDAALAEQDTRMRLLVNQGIERFWNKLAASLGTDLMEALGVVIDDVGMSAWLHYHTRRFYIYNGPTQMDFCPVKDDPRDTTAWVPLSRDAVLNEIRETRRREAEEMEETAEEEGRFQEEPPDADIPD